MLGLFLKEIAKVVVVSAGADFVREKVVPPVSEKISEKLNKFKKDSERSGKKTTADHVVECEANWE